MASLSYPNRALSYHIDVRPEPGGIRVAVQLDQPLPATLVGKAGFNLEFLPTAYFGKSYILDSTSSIFPRHSGGPMEKAADGDVYEGIWRPTLDTYLAEQMDHVKVREAYRIWHGASHLDDALQAPVTHRHKMTTSRAMCP